MEILDWPFRGTDALAAGVVTRHRLRTDFEMVYRNVYLRRKEELRAVADGHPLALDRRPGRDPVTKRPAAQCFPSM